MVRMFAAGMGMAGLALSALLTLGISGGMAEEAPKPTGDLEVVVQVEGGKEIKECSIYAGTQMTTLKGKDIFHIFVQLPLGEVAVTADASVAMGLFKGDQRYVGVQPVVIKEGKRAKVTVTLQPVYRETGKSIEEFCARCHPGKDEEVRPGQMRRDVHPSGKVLPDKFLPAVKKHNDKVASLKPEEMRLPLRPIKLEEREVVEQGKKVKRQFYTCESCHTLHLRLSGYRDYSDYTVAPFRDQSDLCVGCHI
jgi:hypothetical protein